MKKLFLIFVLLLLSSCDTHNISTHINSDNPFYGEWEYYRTETSIGGAMKISNCKDNKCEIEFNTYNGAHICSLSDAQLLFTADSGTIKLNNTDANDCNISLQLIHKDVLNIDYTGNCQYFCGVSGIFTGRWENKNKPITYTAGFDCDKAQSNLETFICQNSDIAEMDRELNTLYTKTSDQKQSQKEWLKEREKCNTNHSCLYELYVSRIRYLVSSLTKKDFTMYDYARLVSSDSYFHPNDAFLIKSFIQNKIGESEYNQFISCSNRVNTNDYANDDFIFASYGCPGLFTSMESSIYIMKDEIWLAYIKYFDTDEKYKQDRFIFVYVPKGKILSESPKPFSDWLKDLKTRIKEDIEIKTFDKL